MANQPYSPTTPPFPEPCDDTCQKDKKLVDLKKDMDSIDPEKEPARYEKSRVAYYTLLNGPGWLVQEKRRIAKEDVEPITTSYKTKFDALNEEIKSQADFVMLANDFKVQTKIQEEDNGYLQKQLMIEKDRSNVENRLSELNASGTTSYAWMSWVVDILITILAVFVLYKLYLRFGSNFHMSSSPVLTST
jgi:hypothetical protein